MLQLLFGHRYSNLCEQDAEVSVPAQTAYFVWYTSPNSILCLVYQPKQHTLSGIPAQTAYFVWYSMTLLSAPRIVIVHSNAALAG